MGYWTARPFLGFGPSAFSYWEGSRFRNVANLSRYCRALRGGEEAVDFREKLEPKAARRELLAINLRVLDGVDLREFEARHGELDEETLSGIEILCGNELLERKGDLIALTTKGVLFYDSVATELS